jgi:hypothetical protein
MSQSDYIKYKKISTELKSLNKYPSVLQEDDYNLFKEYSLENTIQNTKLTFNQFQPPGFTIINGMEKKVTNCPNFPTCKDTNTRSNRKPLGGAFYYPHPLRPLTQKQIAAQTKSTLVTSKLCQCSTI